jgi:hypothetical protein
MTAWTFLTSKSRKTLLQIDQEGSILAVGGDYDLSFSATVAR